MSIVRVVISSLPDAAILPMRTTSYCARPSPATKDKGVASNVRFAKDNGTSHPLAHTAAMADQTGLTILRPARNCCASDTAPIVGSQSVVQRSTSTVLGHPEPLCASLRAWFHPRESSHRVVST